MLGWAWWCCSINRVMSVSNSNDLPDSPTSPPLAASWQVATSTLHTEAGPPSISTHFNDFTSTTATTTSTAYPQGKHHRLRLNNPSTYPLASNPIPLASAPGPQPSFEPPVEDSALPRPSDSEFHIPLPSLLALPVLDLIAVFSGDLRTRKAMRWVSGGGAGTVDGMPNVDSPSAGAVEDVGRLSDVRACEDVGWVIGRSSSAGMEGGKRR